MKLRQLFMLSVCVALAQADGIDEYDIDLTPTSEKWSCLRLDGQEGFCVHESKCAETIVIPPGFLDDYSESHYNPCPGSDMCCPFPKMATTETTTNLNRPTTGKQ
ncbi:uncharacterized protein LOC125242092 [Leguminivora glycinivorella]|uniref:uncharacterized protein LOC125242092 n=1 Tax=Leguminivora glycinivorella TaxID=1035111 RepID=UPI00201003FD|nr:uncharacterized protein LOC125242092 [Leguminivora glycinivorella]